MLDALFAGGAAWFTVPALLGTGAFLIKLVLMFMGGSDDLDIGGDATAADAGQGGVHGHESGLVAIASVQGISAFLMGFGWAGLGAYQGLKWGVLGSMGVGVVGGLAMCVLFLGLLATTRKLQSSGTVNVQQARGSEGEVYANVPAASEGGRGQVRLTLAGRQRIVQAKSAGGAILTGVRVRVVEVKADNSVVVEAV
jgi:hypothetical protein